MKKKNINKITAFFVAVCISIMMFLCGYCFATNQTLPVKKILKKLYVKIDNLISDDEDVAEKTTENTITGSTMINNNISETTIDDKSDKQDIIEQTVLDDKDLNNNSTEHKDNQRHITTIQETKPAPMQQIMFVVIKDSDTKTSNNENDKNNNKDKKPENVKEVKEVKEVKDNIKKDNVIEKPQKKQNNNTKEKEKEKKDDNIKKQEQQIVDIPVISIGIQPPERRGLITKPKKEEINIQTTIILDEDEEVVEIMQEKQQNKNSKFKTNKSLDNKNSNNKKQNKNDIKITKPQKIEK